MRIGSVSAVVLLSASVALADGTIEQKTQFHLAGALGSMINAMSRTAREGVTSTEVVKGNRKLRRTESAGELIDLDAEKVYTIDYGRQTYTVKTFDQLRKEWQEQQERAKRDAARERGKKDEKNEGPEYEVEFAIKSSGAKETINGFNTHEEIVTITGHEKGKKLEDAGGFVMTTNVWMGPKIAAMNDLREFDRRFAQKIYGPAFAADMRSLAAAMAMSPGLAQAMKEYYAHAASFNGSPIRTTMRFETVAGKNQQAESASSDDSSSSAPTSVSSAIVGGLFNKMKQRQAEKKAEDQPKQASAPGHTPVFDSSTEVTKVGAAADADVAIPAGFKQR